jgi:hypothetical protein
MDNNEKKLIQIRTKLEFYKKLDNKINQVLNATLELDDWSGEVFRKIRTLEDELDNLKIEMDLPDNRWDEDEK